MEECGNFLKAWDHLQDVTLFFAILGLTDLHLRFEFDNQEPCDSCDGFSGVSVNHFELKDFFNYRSMSHNGIILNYIKLFIYLAPKR